MFAVKFLRHDGWSADFPQKKAFFYSSPLFLGPLIEKFGNLEQVVQ